MNAKKRISTTKNVTFEQLDGQSILNASIDAAFPINHSCHSGRCGFCKAKVLSGKTQAYRKEELTQTKLENHYILTCARTALTDITLDVGELTQIKIPKSINIPCVINALAYLTPHILKVTLQLPLIARLPYLPGQHIDITNPNGTCRSYSLAKAKVENKMIELHISKVENGAMSQYWFNQAKVGDILTLEGSKGTFFIRDIADKDIYFIATGTGIAPINAILESMATLPKKQQAKSITLIWGNRTAESFYLDPTAHFTPDTINKLQIKYIPTLSVKHKHWQGTYGYVQEVLMALNPKLSNAQVYACGSPVMIHHAQKLLVENGLAEKHFLADAFISNGVNLLNCSP